MTESPRCSGSVDKDVETFAEFDKMLEGYGIPQLKRHGKTIDCAGVSAEDILPKIQRFFPNADYSQQGVIYLEKRTRNVVCADSESGFSAPTRAPEGATPRGAVGQRSTGTEGITILGIAGDPEEAKILFEQITASVTRSIASTGMGRRQADIQ